MAVLLLGACAPMDLDVTNETGGELILRMTSANGGDLEYRVPSDGGLVEYTGAPSLNGSYRATVRSVGRYVLSERSVELVRGELNLLEYLATDVNAFAVVATNSTGARVDSLFFSLDPIADGERPGDNFGPLAGGESTTIPLPSGSPYNFVYYQAGSATVDNSGMVTATGGADFALDL
jgi:hypothetical protein